MKYYDDMNIFDIASVLHNLCFDENKCFIVMINGEPFNLFEVEVDNDNGEILVNVHSERIKIKELEKNVEFNMQRKVKEKLEPCLSDGV